MMYILLLTLMLSISPKAFAQILQGVWKLETSFSLPATSVPLKKEIILKIVSEDSVSWELHEDQVIGTLVDEKGNYAGLEKHTLTEKGSGKIIKGLTKDSPTLRLNIVYSSFHHEEKLVKEYSLSMKNNALLLEALDCEETLELQRLVQKPERH